MANILGNNLVVRIGTGITDPVILCATNCSLNIQQATTEASCKGNPAVAGNKWSTAIAGTASWSITTDGLYDPSMSANSYDVLVGKIITDADGGAANSINLVFEVDVTQAIGDVTFYSGTAIVTSAVLNGPVDEFATYTVEFKGTGALVKNTRLT